MEQTISVNCPLVSIVMLNYNGLKYLQETIPPLQNLTYPNCEIIIVDNGSTDGSLEFIEETTNVKLIKSPRIREKNYACNYAIELSKGEFILLLDNDILITNKNLIQELLDQYFFDEKVGVISLAFYNKGEKVSNGYGGFYNLFYLNDKKKEIPIDKFCKLHGIQIGYPMGIGLFIKKILWEEVGGYEDYLKFGGDDNELGMKVWNQGYNCILYSKTLQIHLGMSERNDNKKYALKFEEMFYSHMFCIFKILGIKKLIIVLLLHISYNFIKSIKQSLIRLDYRCIISFWKSLFLFIIRFNFIYRQRKLYQHEKMFKGDLFFLIKPPTMS